MTILRSPRAVDDVFAIWSYIHDRDEGAADRLLQRIDRKLLSLERYPGIGRSRHEAGDGIRSVTLGRHVLFYRPIKDGIELLRVLHGARDQARVTFD